MARSSHAFALIFCASAIASRKSASASSICPCLSRSSPRSLRISGRVWSWVGIRLESLFDRFNCVDDGAFTRLRLGQRQSDRR